MSLSGKVVFFLALVLFPANCDNFPYCPEGLSWCWSRCVDLSNDNENCGTCDNECGLFSGCQEGTCTCEAGYAECGGLCVNLNFDAANCGSCGSECQPGEVCLNGKCVAYCDCDEPMTCCEVDGSEICVDITSDEEHCGACNHACRDDESCENSQCVASPKVKFPGACEVEYDVHVDGEIDERTTLAYNNEGLLVEENIDSGDDGRIDDRWTYEYLSDGRLSLKKRHDVTNEPGYVDRGYLWIYTYDAMSKLTLEECYECAGGFDGCSDKHPIQQTIYRYDNDGNLAEEEFDNQADGTPDRIITYSYDSNGYLIAAEYDDNADGNVDVVWMYYYDDEGKLVKREVDDYNDGFVDSTKTYFYDEDGNLITEVYVFMDSARTRHTYTCDTAGNLLKDDYDWNDDSEIDVRTIYTYGCWDNEECFQRSC